LRRTSAWPAPNGCIPPSTSGRSHGISPNGTTSRPRCSISPSRRCAPMAAPHAVPSLHHTSIRMLRDHAASVAPTDNRLQHGARRHGSPVCRRLRLRRATRRHWQERSMDRFPAGRAPSNARREQPNMTASHHLNTSGRGSGTNPWRLGISTRGSVCASSTIDLSMILASARMYAETAYISSAVSEPGVANGIARRM